MDPPCTPARPSTGRGGPYAHESVSCSPASLLAARLSPSWLHSDASHGLSQLSQDGQSIGEPATNGHQMGFADSGAVPPILYREMCKLMDTTGHADLAAADAVAAGLIRSFREDAGMLPTPHSVEERDDPIPSPRNATVPVTDRSTYGAAATDDDDDSDSEYTDDDPAVARQLDCSEDFPTAVHHCEEATCSTQIKMDDKGRWLQLHCVEEPSSTVDVPWGGSVTGRQTTAEDMDRLSLCYHRTCRKSGVPTEFLITYNELVIAGGCAQCTFELAWNGLQQLDDDDSEYHIMCREGDRFKPAIPLDQWVTRQLQLPAYMGRPTIRTKKFMVPNPVPGRRGLVVLRNPWKPSVRVDRESGSRPGTARNRRAKRAREDDDVIDLTKKQRMSYSPTE